MNSLPEEYRELQYIESTGTQYIKTGVSHSTSIYWESKFLITMLKGSTNSNYNTIIGNNGAPQMAVYSGGWSTGSTGSNKPFVPVINEIYTGVINKDGDGKYYINGEDTTLSRTGNISNINIFGETNGGTYAKIYYVIFASVSTNEILHYYVPCYRKSDNVIGMYDVISNTFLTNAGTGAFIAGPETQVKASITITISKYRDCDSITRYFKLQASTAAAPAIPTTLTPSGWDTSEPTYTSGSTNTLYYTDCIVFSDGTFQYTDDGNGKAVKSSSYEAAKEAYNKAQAAQDSANATQENLDNLEVGGRNYFLNSNTFTDAGSGSSGITPSIENGLWKIQVASNNSNWHLWSHKNAIEHNFATDDEFVFSFEIKSADANKSTPPTIYFKSGLGYFPCKGSVGSDWSRCYYAGKWNDTNGINLHFGWLGLSGTYYIRKIKFERGNKPTDWTAAPEDVDSAISIAQDTATDITNRINDKENNYNFKYHLDVVVYGDSNKFYPVIIKYGIQEVKRIIMVKRSYAEKAPTDWNTSTHKGSLTLKMLCNFGGWRWS